MRLLQFIEAIRQPRGSAPKAFGAATRLRAVIADCFDRATFHRFLAKGFFFRALRLFVNVGMPAVIVALEIGGGGFTAQIAVDALIIDKKFSSYVFGVFICRSE